METTIKKGTQLSPQLGFLIQFKAKEENVTNIVHAFEHALPIIEKETGTIVWFAFRTNEREFGVFDAFYDEAARQVHWDAGSKSLEKLSAYIEQDSMIVKKVDILQAKLR